MAQDIGRRRLLGLGLAGGAGVALGGLGLPLLLGDGTASAAPRTDPVSMAMHVHASFSEGSASMDAQLHQAQSHGIDVLWWTEHDFRVKAHGYRTAVRFEGRHERELGHDWVWTDATAGAVSGPSGSFVTDEHSPDESGSALRLQVTGPADAWGELTWTGTAWNHTYTTSVVDTVLQLDVLGERLGPDAELVVELLTSYHPARGGRPAGQYTLQYRVGGGGERHLEGRDGLVGVVPVASTGRWQRLTMRLADDMAALWPDLVRGDAALQRLSVAVRARRGATARAVVDRLRFQRTGRDSALALQSALMAEYAGRYPKVRQLQASELSLVLHLNAFGGARRLPSFPHADARKDTSLSAQQAMVRWAHDNGSLVSVNHPLDGVAGREGLARVLVTTGGLGAEAIEIGTHQRLADTTWAYDVAARNAVFLTATGVSDDHSGLDWSTRSARWITSVWAGSREQAGLLSAVDRGRAWFWDLAAWRGTMELLVDGAPAMGGVVLTGEPRTPVRVVVTDIPTGGSVELVVGRVDLAGTADLRPAVDVRPAPPGDRTVAVPPDRYVRAVVRSRSGAVVGFSNPVWVLRQAPPGGVPAARLLRAQPT